MKRSKRLDSAVGTALPSRFRRLLIVGAALAVVAVGVYAYRPLRSAQLRGMGDGELDRRLEVNPKEDDAAVLLAERRLGAGDFAGAEEVVQRSLNAGAGEPRLWLLKSRAELGRGLPAQAYASLRVAMPYLQQDPEAHWRLGLLLERRGDEAGAEAEFHAALRVRPEYPEANLELARSALAHRHYAPARSHLETVLRVSPRGVLAGVALELLSQTYVNLGELATAVARAREAVAIDATSPGAHLALARALHAQATPASLTEALVAYRKALELEPENSDTHYQIGRILFSERRYPDAERSLREALRLQPLNRQAYPLLLQCVLRRGDASEAARVKAEYARVEEMDLSTAPLEYAIYAMPENTALRLKLARLYVRYKRPDLAISQVERILELNPVHGEAIRLRHELGGKGR